MVLGVLRWVALSRPAVSIRRYNPPVKKTAKIVYVCQSCAFSSPKWLGRCPGCEAWNSFAEERADVGPSHSLTMVPSVSYGEIEMSDFPRMSSGSEEFDRVLGGGIVPGSLVLLGGEPGVGKSTLLLQVAEGLSARGMKVLYVAGEESLQQIKLRGERIGVAGSKLFLSCETCIERAVQEAAAISPSLLIVDSIQTVYAERLGAVPGSVGQIRECCAELLDYSKKRNVPTFLIGHITKDGSIAGPKLLEHIVDTVLYFEGDRNQNHKIVRAVKNRFGPANELGIFQMSSSGLSPVENASRMFLSDNASRVPGSVALCSLEGTRPVLVEVQALVCRSNYGNARRVANGVDPNRLSLLLAVIEKRLGFPMMASDVFVNLAGGLTLNEPALDLALVVALLSSVKDKPLLRRTAVFGEVGLGGEVRPVRLPDARVKEACGLGFERVILPIGNLPVSQAGVELVGWSSLSDWPGCLDTRAIMSIE